MPSSRNYNQRNHVLNGKYGLIDVLVEKGLVTKEEVLRRMEKVVEKKR